MAERLLVDAQIPRHLPASCGASSEQIRSTRPAHRAAHQPNPPPSRTTLTSRRERHPNPRRFRRKLCAAILALVAKSDQKAYADAYYEISTVDLRPQVSKIIAPTLLLFAHAGTPREDKLVKWISDQMRPVKNREIVVLTGTKHFVMHDDFAAFSKALDTFLLAH